MIVGELRSGRRAGTLVVAPLRPPVKDAAARLASLGPVGPPLDRRSPLRWMAVNVALTRNASKSRISEAPWMIVGESG
jgi:hypothetical protein